MYIIVRNHAMPYFSRYENGVTTWASQKLYAKEYTYKMLADNKARKLILQTGDLTIQVRKITQKQ